MLTSQKPETSNKKLLVNCVWAIPEHGLSRGIEKIKCGNSRGQEKIMWNFIGYRLVGISKRCNTIFGICRGEASFCLKFLRVK